MKMIGDKQIQEAENMELGKTLHKNGSSWEYRVL